MVLGKKAVSIISEKCCFKCAMLKGATPNCNKMDLVDIGKTTTLTQNQRSQPTQII